MFNFLLRVLLEMASLRQDEELIDVLTSTIFVSSVTHASVNFTQYDEYGFPPNAPLWLNGAPPTNKVLNA